MGGTVESLRAAFETANSWSGWATLAVVAGVAIDFVVLLLFSREMNRVEKALLALANVAIVVGCGGEWWFGGNAADIAGEIQRRSDLQVAALNARAAAAELQVAKLETKIAPRELPPDKQQEVAVKIKAFAGTRFDLAVHVEIEPMRLLDQIEDAVSAGDWVEQPGPSVWAQFNRLGRPPVGIKSVAGIWIIWPTKSERLHEAAAALQTALAGEEIATTVVEDRGDAEYDQNVVHIWVGGKP